MTTVNINDLEVIIRKIIRDENKVVTEKIDEFQKSLDFYSNHFDEINREMVKLREENNTLKKNSSELKLKYDKLENELNKLKLENEEDKQYARNKNLIINGVYELEKENLIDITTKIAEAIGVKIKKDDLQAVHRLKSNTRKSNDPDSIIVQFTNRLVREEFLKKSREIRPTTTFLYSSLQERQIYVNEHLTPYYKKLMFDAKNKKIGNQNVYKFVWFRNGKLFVRKTENSQILRIKAENDL